MSDGELSPEQYEALFGAQPPQDNLEKPAPPAPSSTGAPTSSPPMSSGGTSMPSHPPTSAYPAGATVVVEATQKKGRGCFGIATGVMFGIVGAFGLLLVGCVGILAIASNETGDETTVESQEESATDTDSEDGVASEPAATGTESEDIEEGVSEPDETQNGLESTAENEVGAGSDNGLTPSQNNAIESAQSLVDTLPFSRQGLLDQLTSEFGSQFSEEDATFAVDSLSIDWNEEAIEGAQSLVDTLPISRQGLLDQLTSEFGSQFTQEEATFAVESLTIDWNEEAEEAAQSLSDSLSLSCDALLDQLTSEFGSQFTQEEASFGAQAISVC